MPKHNEVVYLFYLLPLTSMLYSLEVYQDKYPSEETRMERKAKPCWDYFFFFFVVVTTKMWIKLNSTDILIVSCSSVPQYHGGLQC